MSRIALRVTPETRVPEFRVPPKPIKTLSAAKVAEVSVAGGVHPLAVAIPIAACTWFVLVGWVAFARGETSLILAIVTFFAVIYCGLIGGGGALARNVADEKPRTRSFKQFLNGSVETATGRISGSAALWQIATMPVLLAVTGTIIIAIAVSARG